MPLKCLDPFLAQNKCLIIVSRSFGYTSGHPQASLRLGTSTDPRGRAHVAAPCPPGIVPSTILPPPPQEMLSHSPQWSAHSLRTRSGLLSPSGHSAAPLSPLSGRGSQAF